MTERQRTLADDAATRELGQRIAAALVGIDRQATAHEFVIYLQGPLGAGKSTLARGMIRALGHKGAVPSPTYSLAESYDLEAWQVIHMDLYRIADPGEVEYLGVLDGDSAGDRSRQLLIIEWPERGRGAIPPADLHIALDYRGDQREAILRAESEEGIAIMEKIDIN